MTDKTTRKPQQQAVDSKVYPIDFSLPPYSNALYQLIEDVLISFHNTDPLLSNFPARHTEHYGPIRSVRGGDPLDQPMDSVEFNAQLSREIVERGDVLGYAEFLQVLSDRRMEAMGPGFFRRINAIVSAIGNAVDAGGKAFTYGTYLDVLSKSELIYFEDDGTPHLPKLFGGGEAMQKIRQCTPTEDEKRQLAEIIERKRREYFAQKRTRRLSQ